MTLDEIKSRYPVNTVIKSPRSGTKGTIIGNWRQCTNDPEHFLCDTMAFGKVSKMYLFYNGKLATILQAVSPKLFIMYF